MCIRFTRENVVYMTLESRLFRDTVVIVIVIPHMKLEGLYDVSVTCEAFADVIGRQIVPRYVVQITFADVIG